MSENVHKFLWPIIASVAINMLLLGASMYALGTFQTKDEAKIDVEKLELRISAVEKAAIKTSTELPHISESIKDLKDSFNRYQEKQDRRYEAEVTIISEEDYSRIKG